jgi:hypothetical protein
MNKYFISLIIIIFLVSACAPAADTKVTVSPEPVYNNNEQNPEDVAPVVDVPKEPVFPLPVMDMTAADKYLGESGGLYGNGLNIPPETHRQGAILLASKIQPLDANGAASTQGKIGFVVLGHNNARLAFDKFMKYADVDDQINSRIVFVNGAQDGTDAYQWATNPIPMSRLRLAMENTRLTNKQVQVAWIELSDAKPIGEFPYDADKFQKYLYNIVLKVQLDYPNMKMVYISSDVYAGYSTSDVMSEPYAYEYAFPIKWLINDQINGNTALNYDLKKGVVKAPIILWGPYLWANDDNARSDGLVWQKSDFQDDGMTLNDAGTTKVTQMLMDFFKNTEYTTTWFLKSNQ